MEPKIYIASIVLTVAAFLYEVFRQPPIVRRKHPNPTEAKRRYRERMLKKEQDHENIET